MHYYIGVVNRIIIYVLNHILDVYLTFLLIIALSALGISKFIHIDLFLMYCYD